MQKLFRQALIQCQSGRIHYTSVSRSTLVPTQTRELQRPQRFQIGEPIYAHNRVHEYPEDYRPWTIYYKGHGFLVATAALTYFAYIQFDGYWLSKCEYTERPKDRKYYRP